MSSNTLLLISDKKEDGIFASEIAMSCGLSLKQVAQPKEAMSIIDREEPRVILIENTSEAQYQALEASVQETVGLFSDKINANVIHFISAQSLDKVGYLTQSPLFGHLILRNFKDPVEAGKHYSRVVRATLLDKAFGLENLVPAGTKIQVVKLVSSTQKNDAVEAVKAYLLGAKFQARTASMIANAVDELILNAVFDAPVDELGKQIYARTARSTAIKLEGPNEVLLKIAFDGQYVAISVIDQFGSLEKSKFLSHVSKVYVDEQYQLRSTVANAGIGLATVFKSGGSFFFVSENRTRTECTVFFKRTVNFKESKEQFRFLSTQFYF